jgi:hypothetical protein
MPRRRFTSGEVEEGVLEDIARRHSMEVVGPVPEGYV